MNEDSSRLLKASFWDCSPMVRQLILNQLIASSTLADPTEVNNDE